MSQTATTRKEFEAALIAKAQADRAFRQALLNNSSATIEKEFGVTLRAGAELKVVEETATSNYLVLPAATSGELLDSELKAASGGARSDIGQKLQFMLNEANSIYN